MKPASLLLLPLLSLLSPPLTTATPTPNPSTPLVDTPAFCPTRVIYPDPNSQKGSYYRLYNTTGYRQPKHNSTTTLHNLLAKNLTDGCEALTECAAIAYGQDPHFFNFQLLYTRSKARYSCISYGFLSYYDQVASVRDRDVLIGYGFQSTGG